MNDVSLRLEGQLQTFMSSMQFIHREAEGIVRAYFATNASSLVSGLAQDSTPATVSTKLTKVQFINMIGALQQVEKFFENQAVTTGDYLNNLQNVVDGSAVLATPLSNEVEALGVKIRSIAVLMLGLYPQAVDLVEVYNTSQLGSAVAAVSDHIVVYGANKTKSVYLSGIVLTDNFAKMLGNQAVAQANYEDTVSLWV